MPIDEGGLLALLESGLSDECAMVPKQRCISCYRTALKYHVVVSQTIEQFQACTAARVYPTCNKQSQRITDSREGETIKGPDATNNG